MNKTIIVIWVVLAMMAAGCGKVRTCQCNYDNSYYDIIDTALYDSVFSIGIVSVYPEPPRESAVECSYWNYHDTVGRYIPEYGIRSYTVLECYEKGE